MESDPQEDPQEVPCLTPWEALPPPPPARRYAPGGHGWLHPGLPEASEGLWGPHLPAVPAEASAKGLSRLGSRVDSVNLGSGKHFLARHTPQIISSSPHLPKRKVGRGSPGPRWFWGRKNARESARLRKAVCWGGLGTSAAAKSLGDPPHTHVQKDGPQGGHGCVVGQHQAAPGEVRAFTFHSSFSHELHSS